MNQDKMCMTSPNDDCLSLCCSFCLLLLLLLRFLLFNKSLALKPHLRPLYLQRQRWQQSREIHMQSVAYSLERTTAFIGIISSVQRVGRLKLQSRKKKLCEIRTGRIILLHKRNPCRKRHNFVLYKL